MRALIVNNKGEVEVDPSDKKGQYERWLASITLPEGLNYASLKGISALHSEFITKYVLDLSQGKNMAKGHKKGARSYIHRVQVRHRLNGLFILLEKCTGKRVMDFSEDDILGVFNGMRSGAIKTRSGRSFLDVSSYAKNFCAFWRWYVRIQRKEGKTIPDVVDSLDTSADHKPKWNYFTLQDVERMCNIAPYFEYRALLYFLFDSGIRAPKEMMNVRVMDLTTVPGTAQYYLNIRDETSKTFGRKIKLMICSDFVRKHIQESKLKPQDFVFSKSPVCYNRVIAKMGYKILGVGNPKTQRKPNGQVHKTIVYNGITMYDFRHNSVCHYLPIYKSENQMKYRYGWTKSDMIHYYSEFIGMKDTITDDDMLIDTTKTEIQQQLMKEQQKVVMLEERMAAQKQEMEERFKRLEAQMLQRFANNY